MRSRRQCAQQNERAVAQAASHDQRFADNLELGSMAPTRRDTNLTQRMKATTVHALSEVRSYRRWNFSG
jgi:hypothetical protein